MSETIAVSEKLEKIINSISELSVLELAELVKALEKKFGVSAAAPVAMMAAPAGGAQEGGKKADAEQTEFTVVLKSSGDKKIQVIKVIRELTGLGLKEAKDLVDKVPSNIKAGIGKEEAESIKTKVEEQGAQVEIK